VKTCTVFIPLLGFLCRPKPLFRPASP
jgi:hypothetical protein